MMSNDQFVERVFDNFDQLRDKMDQQHSEISQKVGDLCDRMTKIESEFGSHLEVGKQIKEFDVNKLERKEKKFYVVIAIIGAVFTAVNTVISLN